MKWLLIVAAVVVALGIVLLAVGAMLPREHKATRSTSFKRPASEVFAAITDFPNLPAWRAGVTAIELLPAVDEKARYRETSRFGQLTYEVEEWVAGRRLVTRIVDEGQGFGGRWIFEVRDDPAVGGSRLTITEDGYVSNLLFRVLTRFVFGHTKTMDDYLTSLGNKFGEAVTPA